jgi:hypothetical protein
VLSTANDETQLAPACLRELRAADGDVAVVFVLDPGVAGTPEEKEAFTRVIRVVHPVEAAALGDFDGASEALRFDRHDDLPP